MKIKTLIPIKLMLTLLFTAVPSMAQDAQNYCRYVQSEAAATAVQLQTPQAVAGITQPNTGTAFQLYSGVQGSLSDYRKGHLTREAGKTNCALYQSTLDAQQAIQYSQAFLEHAALQHRVALVDLALRRIDEAISKSNAMVQAQSATRLSLYALQSARGRLLADRISSERVLSAAFVPDLSPVPLSKLVAVKQQNDEQNQSAQSKIARASNFDFRWEVGYHKTPSTSSGLVTPSGPYGGFAVIYNIGSHKVDQHLDDAEKAYSAWKRDADADVFSSADTLRQQLVKSIQAEDERRAELGKQMDLLTTNLGVVQDASTSQALTYANELQSDRVLLEVEAKDSEFRLSQLKAYLAHNFGEQPPGEAVVSLTFDDGYQTAFAAASILDKAGLHGTFYIITKALGGKDYMTADEVKALVARGHEIGAHTRTHPHLPTLTLAQQEAEIGGSKQDLQAMGIEAKAFAYPYGEHDDNSIVALQVAGFTSARTTDRTLSGQNPLSLQGYSITPETTVSDVVAAIDYAERNNTHLILTGHRVGEDGNAISWKLEQLQAVVDYLVKTGVKVKTVSLFR